METKMDIHFLCKMFLFLVFFLVGCIESEQEHTNICIELCRVRQTLCHKLEAAHIRITSLKVSSKLHFSGRLDLSQHKSLLIKN